MNCPWCGAEMEEGRFHSRGGNHYLPEGRKVTWLTEKAISAQGGILFPPDFLAPTLHPEHPKAWHCRTCRKLVLPY